MNGKTEQFPIFAALALGGVAIASLAAAAGAPPTNAAPESYRNGCASCHGPALGGGFGPALSGAEFQKKWNGRSQDLLAYIKTTMPPSQPSSLSADAYAAITNYIVASNNLGAAAKSAANSDNIVASDKNVLTSTDVNADAVAKAAELARRKRLDALTPVTDDMLQSPSSGDWLHWRRDYAGLGFSPLNQINDRTVRRLVPAWALSLKSGTNEITPLVHDGVLFINSSGAVQAIDVASGDVLWEHNLPATVSPMPNSQPRGMAVRGHALYVPTNDSHIVALDMRSGEVLWDHAITAAKEVQLTSGPLVVKDKIIQGVSGCFSVDYAEGCYIVALDAETGKEAWRFHTIAKPGEPGGDTWNGAPANKRFGASIWSTASYDAGTGLLYVGTSQTYHVAPLIGPGTASSPKASALFTDSTLALDPDTGKLVWYYQHLGRDVWDLDWAFERMVIDPNGDGRKMVATMGKVGIVDALDAKTGKYLFSKDMGVQTLITHIDPVTGRKTTDPAAEPRKDGAPIICPSAVGARNWPATSFDPKANVLFVPLSDNCMAYNWNPAQKFDISAKIMARPGGDGMIGALAALDLRTKRILWMHRSRAPVASAVLATAGGLVFAGRRDRDFEARDSRTGALLWKTTLNAPAYSYPISFSAHGVQYVAVVSGGGNSLDAVMRPLTPEIRNSAQSTTLNVFRLASE